MIAISIPLGQPDWWEHCTDENGDPVHIVTSEDIGKWTDESHVLDLFVEKLHERLNKTLNEALKGEKDEYIIQIG